MTKKKTVEVKYMPHQGKLLDAILNKGVIQANLRGGVGCGKTSTLALALYMMQRQWPYVPYLIGSNTMMNLVACSKGIGEFLQKVNLIKSSEFELHLSGINPHLTLSIVKDGRRITVNHPLRSLYDPTNLVSFEVGGMLIDEVASCNEEGFMAAFGRVRRPNSPLVKIYAGTPRGPNWFAKFIERELAENRILNLTKIRTKDNIFLPTGFIEDTYGKYEGTPWAAQELSGEIVTMGDVCFPVVNLRDYTPDPKKGWHLGVDFGFNFPAFVCLQEVGSTGSYCIFHTYFPRNITITDALAGLMAGLGQRWGMTTNPFRVAYDPAGRNASDQTYRTAADDLEDFFKERDPMRVPHFHYSFKKVDRSIAGGIQNLNILLSKNKIFVAKHEEKKKPGEHSSIYQCLSMQEYNKIKNIIDQSGYRKDNGLDHGCDALRYVVNFTSLFSVLDIRGRSVAADPRYNAAEVA